MPEPPKPKQAPPKPQAVIEALVLDTPKPKTTAPAPAPAKKPVPVKAPTPLEAPLSKSEEDSLAIALAELSDLADSGAWYLGLDTDPDVPTADGSLGQACFHMTLDEARVVVKSFVSRGRAQPLILKSARALIAAHTDLMTGLILGSRFWDFGMRLFKDGLNLRNSKLEWSREVGRQAGRSAAIVRPGAAAE